MSRTQQCSFGFGVLALLSVFATPADAAAVEAKSKGGLTYMVRVPASFDQRVGARLVVALHGRGGSHKGFIGSVERASYLKDAILIAPNASSNKMWGEPDLPLIAGLIDEFKARYHVTRTILFGYSAGAYCSFSLASRYPEKIQALIPHSGGLAATLPDSPALKALGVYVIHGDADKVVPFSGSQEAVKQLKAKGVRVHLHELPGVGHTMKPDAIAAGFAWIRKTLGPPEAPLPDADAQAAIKSVDEALDAKAWPKAAAAFPGLAGAPRGRFKAIAGLIKRALRAGDEAVSLAAIKAAGHLGPVGVKLLKGVSKKDETLSAAAAWALARTHDPAGFKTLFAYLKGKSDPVSVAAAKALGRHGGLPGVPLLIKGLKAARKSDARKAAIQTALEQATGASCDSVKAWSRWLSQQRR